MEESENDKIDAEYDKVCAAFDEAVRGYANEAMAVSDIESQAWAESLLLQASRARDREWSDRVQDARELLESQREVYRQHELVLEETQESITAMRNKIMVDVERDQMKAQNQVAEMTQLVDKTTHELAEKEAALNDELGFLDAANEFPNDADVQEWILTTIVALLDGHEPNDSEVVAEELLLRPEFGAVVQNALTRFPTVHRLQWRAVACLATLVARATSLLEQDDESLWRAGRSKNALISFLDSLIAMKINVLTLCRDAITRFNRDVELNALVASIHFHLLRVRLPSSNSSSSIQCAVRFGHEPRNQLLPMELLQLFESSQAHWSDNPRGYHVTIRDASFLLFTVTKCNAEKALLQNHAIPMIVRLVLCLSSSSETASVPFLDLDELKTESLQYLLASLTFLHAVTWFPSMSATVAMNRGTRAVQNAKRELEDIHPWTVDGLMELLTALSPMLAPSIDCTLPRYCHLVAFWMLKLLRNLVLHRGPAAHSVRVRLYDAKLFDILANVKEIAAGLAETSGSRLINGFIDTPDQPARDEVIGVWLDLVEEVWIRHYNASGQLQPTVAYAVDHVLALLSSVTQDMSDSALEATLNANTRVLCATALLATNGMSLGCNELPGRLFPDIWRCMSTERNAIRIGTHGNKVDAAVSVFLQWLLKLRLLSFASSDGSRNELQGHSELVFEAVVHVLRIYLALFTEQVKSVAGGHPPCRILHDRCRAVGICVILRAFRDWNAQRNGEARNEGSEAVVEVRRSTTKKPARTEPCGVTRREASSGEDAAARRIVIALSRAVDDIVQCKC